MLVLSAGLGDRRRSGGGVRVVCADKVRSSRGASLTYLPWHAYHGTAYPGMLTTALLALACLPRHCLP